MTSRTLQMSALVLGAMLASLPGVASAADKEHPDWPCLQKKVENLAASQVWDGPAIDGIKGWLDDEAVSNLIKVISSRKNPLTSAEDSVKKFAEGLPAAGRDAKLTLLFAGLFDQMTAERRTIMKGIEKYTRSQRKRAEDVEDKGKTLAELESKQNDSEEAAAAYAKAQEDYDWQTRIFKERNDNIPIACELPVLIDQRLFDLAKTIRGLMKP